MPRSLLLLFVAVLFPCTGFSQILKHPPTREVAIKLAKAYLKANFPEYDTSANPPRAKRYAKTVMNFTDVEKHGGSIWAVTFPCPPPKDPETGEPTSPMLYINLIIWVCADGYVPGGVMSTH